MYKLFAPETGEYMESSEEESIAIQQDYMSVGTVVWVVYIKPIE